MAEDTETRELDALFSSATDYVRQISSQLDAKNLLFFYGRFKQAKEGKCNVPKPGFFDFQGKSKWEAWNQLDGMTATQAKKEYVSLLYNLDSDWLNKVKSKVDDPNSTQSSDKEKGQAHKHGLGVSVSVLARTEGDLNEDEKTVYDWCKEGNVEKVKAILSQGKTQINGLDSEGLSLLHWASDRGLKEMVELLLSMDADIDLQDTEQQTALHYAVSCEHSDVIKLLISRGIDQSMKDEDGNTAYDLASDDMKLLVRQISSG